MPKNHTRLRSTQVLAGSLLFGAFLGSTAAAPPGEMVEVTANAYPLAKDTHGVVVMAVAWGRVWNVCGAENI